MLKEPCSKKKMLKEQSCLMLPWLDLSNILKKKIGHDIRRNQDMHGGIR